jgi:Tfp pilus assembly protein PilF
MLDRASAALDLAQFDAAEAALVGVLAMAPDCVEAQRLLGMARHLRGDHAQAVAILRQALASSPDDALIHANLGSALCACGAIDEAMAPLQRACELAPELPIAWFNLGRACKLQVEPERARAALQRALQLDPGHIPARIVLAEVQTSLGDIAAATVNYREVLRRRPGTAEAWIALANQKQPFSVGDASALRRALRAPGTPDTERAMLGFALASALEDLADYSGAFDALERANALKRRHVSWNRVAASAHVDAIRAAFARPTATAADAQLGHEVIFVVCLPRSGSTLAEQIFASHPDVEGAGELTDLLQIVDAESARRGQPFPQWVASTSPAEWTRMGLDYLARTERWRRRRPRFTDKNVLNWQLVGAAMAMLPGARVVNCRRDAVENCFGCYRQLFPRGSDFSYDLEDIAACWRDYDRLSQHWQRLFPGRFLDHSYEALLADPEAQVRRLLEFCELPYDPGCLEFHRTRRVVRTASAAQVRQPLQRGTPRSALYGDKLDRLRALLDAAI